MKLRSRLSHIGYRRLLLLIWLLFALAPLYWTFVTAFKAPIDIFQGPRYAPFIDFTPTLTAWETLFGPYRDEFFKGLVNSIVLATASSMLSVLLGGLAAYGLSRYQYRYWVYRNDNLSYLIVSQRIMPPIVAVLALYIVFRTMHLLDTHVGMILEYTSFNLPLAVYLLRSFFDAIPTDLEQAAAVDGYGRVARLVRVVFPLAAPGLAAAFMLSFFFAWNDFLFALILTFDAASTLPIFITNLNAQMEPMWSVLSAVATIAIIPPAIIAIYLDRYMQRQVLRGGVR